MYAFDTSSSKEALIRAELWYGVNFEMVNSLSDFFIRRTGAMYFNIDNVLKYKEIVLSDLVQYLDWDENRITSETQELEQLIMDATHFYDKEF